MTLIQYLPQWVWDRWKRLAPQNCSQPNDKGRQILPKAPTPARPATFPREDSNLRGERLLGRL
jgi:hypothetical protein